MPFRCEPTQPVAGHHLIPVSVAQQPWLGTWRSQQLLPVTTKPNCGQLHFAPLSSCQSLSIIMTRAKRFATPAPVALNN